MNITYNPLHSSFDIVEVLAAPSKIRLQVPHRFSYYNYLMTTLNQTSQVNNINYLREIININLIFVTYNKILLFLGMM